jgi:hypothetical protein
MTRQAAVMSVLRDLEGIHCGRLTRASQCTCKDVCRVAVSRDSFLRDFQCQKCTKYGRIPGRWSKWSGVQGSSEVPLVYDSGSLCTSAPSLGQATLRRMPTSDAALSTTASIYRSCMKQLGAIRSVPPRKPTSYCCLTSQRASCVAQRRVAHGRHSLPRNFMVLLVSPGRPVSSCASWQRQSAGNSWQAESSAPLSRMNMTRLQQLLRHGVIS